MNKNPAFKSTLLKIDDMFFKEHPFVFSKKSSYDFEKNFLKIELSEKTKSLLDYLFENFSYEIKKRTYSDILERPYFLYDSPKNKILNSLRMKYIYSILVFSKEDFHKETKLSKERIRQIVAKNNKEINNDNKKFLLLNIEKFLKFYGFTFIESILKKNFIKNTSEVLFYKIQKYNGYYLEKKLFLIDDNFFDNSFLIKEGEYFKFKNDEYNKELKIDYSRDDFVKDLIKKEKAYSHVTVENIWDFYLKSPTHKNSLKNKTKLLNKRGLIGYLERKNQISYTNNVRDKIKIILPFYTKEEKLMIGKLIENDILLLNNNIFSFEKFVRDKILFSFRNNTHPLSKYFDTKNYNCIENISSILYPFWIRNESFEADYCSFRYPVVYKKSKYEKIFKTSKDIAFKILSDNFKNEGSFFIADIFKESEYIKNLGFEMSWWTINVNELYKSNYLSMKKIDGKSLYFFIKK